MATISSGDVMTWRDAITNSLQDLWRGIIGSLPEILGALLILVIGWIIAIGIGRVVTRLLKLSRLDKFFDKFGVHKVLERMGSKMHVSDFIGALTRWFFIIVAVVAAADVLDLAGVTEFLTRVLFYLPNVIVAVVILLASVVLGNFAQIFVRGTVKAAGLMSANALGLISKWVIIVFAILAALVQLGIATVLVQTVFIGFVAMVALAGGLAFGIGGQGAAKSIVDDLKKQLQNGGASGTSRARKTARTTTKKR